MIGMLWRKWTAGRKARKLERAVRLVEAQGLTVCEIATKSGTDYIRAGDGSWYKIGRGETKKRATRGS